MSPVTWTSQGVVVAAGLEKRGDTVENRTLERKLSKTISNQLEVHLPTEKINWAEGINDYEKQNHCCPNDLINASFFIHCIM